MVPGFPGLPFPAGIPRQPPWEAAFGSSTSHFHSQVFYWSHLSYIPVWFLLLLHGPHFWKWFLIPGSLFFLEKVLGWVWRRAGDLHILEAKLLPSKVGMHPRSQTSQIPDIPNPTNLLPSNVGIHPKSQTSQILPSCPSQTPKIPNPTILSIPPSQIPLSHLLPGLWE